MCKTKKIQIRKCCGCGKEINKENLIKITRNKNGKVRIKPDSKFTGRSVYICKKRECIEKALKKVPPDEITDLKIEILYDGNGARPTAFKIEYCINGDLVDVPPIYN